MLEQEIYNDGETKIVISKSPLYIKIKINKQIHYFMPDGDYDGWSKQEGAIMEIVKK